MPVILLDRLPLPNLKTYACGSVVALSACLYFAAQVIKDPNWNSSEGDVISNNVAGVFGGTGTGTGTGQNRTNTSSISDSRTVSQYVSEIFTVMIREPVCVWNMINMAFCWLILLGRVVQKLVFGDLRVSEQQHLKDKFWNFVFYKFIFVFGVINVQYLDEVLVWCSWFSLLGFLHLLSQLSKDRFEYLSFSPTTPVWNHVKLLALLGCIFALSGFMFLVSIFVGFFGGFNTFAFMSAEVILLSIRTLHVILRYILHLYDMRHEGTDSITNVGRVWEKRGPVAYYTELGFELSALIIDFIHHIHMLLWSNIFLSMASLVICMQLRYLLNEIQRRYKKHVNYLWVRNHLEKNYPMASAEELSANSDNCAICWEKMDSARKLPCSHLFHNTCLQSWLEQDTSCPTCRLALSIQSPAANRLDVVELQADQPQPARRHFNHFFHFDGSRYVSWLPSFSVEVSHAQLNPENPPAPNSQLDAMARQVQQLFPNLPLSTIISDLRLTRSVEMTIENVLDGRLVAPQINTMFRDTVPMNNHLSLLQSTNPTDSTTTRNWNDDSVDNTIDAEDTVTLGSRFSKSSSERERILHKRKETLIHNARKRYLEKHNTAKSELQS